LNHHTLSNALAAWFCRDDPSRWVTPHLILARSYIHLVAAQQKANRIHLADVWASCAPQLNSADPLRVEPSIRARQLAQQVIAGGNHIQKPVCSVVLGSGSVQRRIEPEVFSGWFCAMPEENRPQILLIGGVGEEPLAQRFIRQAHAATGIVNLIGKCSPEELVGVFSLSDLVLGVDTGPLHWAAAAGCRTLGFYFGEAGFHATGPYGDGHVVLAPNCREYPCHPNRAQTCHWVCRQAFGDSANISEFIMSLLQKESKSVRQQFEGLQAHISTLKPDGNMYRAIDPSHDKDEWESLACAVRQVLGLNAGSGAPRSRLPIDSHSARILRDFKRLWESEIEQITLPVAVSKQIVAQAKVAAIQQLSKAFADCIRDEDSPAERRLFSDQFPALRA
jgi:hypothetical protein